MKTENNAARGKVMYFSRLRALACIAVVVLHTFYACNSFSATLTDTSVMLSVRNLMMWAVPVFIMVSGALLLDKKRDITYKKLFTRYLPRMVFSLVIFTFLFAVFDGASDGNLGLDSVSGAVKQILYGTGWRHMWYLYLMIAVYLLLPFYRMIAASLKRSDTYYLLGVYALFLIILPTIEALTEIKTAFYICVYSVYPFYLFLGYALNEGTVRINRFAALAVFLISSVAIGALTVYSVQRSNDIVSGLLGNYSFPLIALQAFGIFAFACGADNGRTSIIDKIISEIDRCSFGIYLIHMLVLKLIVVVLGWNPMTHGGLIMVFLLSVGVLIVSYAVVFLLKLVPFVKKLV